ncbi:CDP-diacylglycerol--glycerol-3-phosphate 3-phosphatidyltransferase [Solemya velum gill symbiont]|uniref:CDP-diacylglycerol--glycerol-3-phosphate 3-phosphatidyltransferase n=1 Tax=Solemya velum gill symbiont TaxID=2340 RepID=UPI000996B3B5|nr:CDP-diacylglycerol--glycerol-3-phosphate 3-phosphatidyltransferase [Solemya velum gill symbiont]OOZ43684.1 CDP-diacylglycerol--glycerol-3-phosphate 3-phosphatidyltransferase [Solemya velum gill symbiont]OOZ45627.1 CDP-diacylglycerol--glycerol-3-phosphate 3-phosphatidyltransferase [Solemya velum gill symbiont]OOZ48535.1 CDP-diacylglycerol--glycerol-3-phosphate 3-phosphatidyltransferase [Solemya velum gill symbiont]OOZ50721.1 CDP-diacylglycerol--glycerol-3-phosphate 3-phosphatidyltransferase [
MQWNLPNILTLLRILLIPVLVFVFFQEQPWARLAAAIIFIVAALTDWFDGYLARQLEQTSKFGAFLDPVADKLIVAAALVLLVSADPRVGVTVAAVVIVGREITISALREWMAELGGRTTVAVSMIGKFKTAAQMIAISLMLWQSDLFGLPIYQLGLVLLYIAAVLTIWSMIAYLRAAWPILKQ